MEVYKLIAIVSHMNGLINVNVVYVVGYICKFHESTQTYNPRSTVFFSPCPQSFVESEKEVHILSKLWVLLGANMNNVYWLSQLPVAFLYFHQL